MKVNNLWKLCGALSLLGLLFATLAGASSEPHSGPPKSVQPKSYANPMNDSKCLLCHGQLDYLRSIVEDTKDGYGHDVAAETVAQGLYVASEFVNDRIHGKASCEFCHAGDPDTMNVEKAHEGIVKDPTADGGQAVCASCHKDIVDNFKTSIHFNMTGVKLKLSDRLGTTPHKEEVVGKIMEADCLNCHATCGSCHVGTPPVANAGLQKNHSFEREPDNLQVCIPCHHLAGAGFFTEEKNLHSALGMDCVSCHSTEQQFHGRGGPEEPMGMMTPGLIEADCHNCHQQIDSSNAAHEMHNDSVACQSCHGTEYESCISCHDRVPDMEHIFKLGDFKGKIYPFVHTTGNMSADMFKHLGIELKQDDLESKPTWMPYPTHFLQLAPIHKEGAKVMCENCHGNDEIFLQEEDLTFPDLEKQYLKETPRALSERELKKAAK
ncbi:MAG: hypothetical protein C0617_00015 [Desulfuromonas sp.]|uniref:multiheme c-type cytochrome n=1 Tax=Desulfuromonas sp. TaxID=892 RepID=UPI000CAFEA0C|nr:multiheme c-type cytochrome [Desulfuromonas sp.]PLX86753.1 MAG: hypothetical protein C0617_00015 [Desulfuromonas sp.]